MLSEDEQVLADLHFLQMLVVSRQLFKCLKILFNLDLKWLGRWLIRRFFWLRLILKILQF